MSNMGTTSSRRRPKTAHSTASDQQQPSTPKQINAAAMLDNPRSPLELRYDMGLSKAIAVMGVMATGILPTIVSWGLTMGLIFGGCCSNVFALEAMVKDEPDSGLLITLAQFLTIFCFTLPSHLTLSNPPSLLKKRHVPLTRWLPAIAMFFAVNMLNNYAFGFSISVPVHIILRSGGSVATMVVGYIWGKRYTKGQVFGVAMLTIGVIVAALADAQSKGKMDTHSSGSTASFVSGLLILFVAQLISAVMGLYIQLTYAKYGPHWHENLFYSHFLSLPLFAPLLPSLWRQFQKLLKSPDVVFSIPTGSLFYGADTEAHNWKSSLDTVRTLRQSLPSIQFGVPVQIINLALNGLTQYGCIRGVNLLGTRTSALGVTIVLNVRKLISLFLSIWLFGNSLPVGVAAGASIVFAGAAVYGWSGQQSARKKPEQHDAEKPKAG